MAEGCEPERKGLPTTVYQGAGELLTNAFGILVSRFRVMLTTIELPPETVREVVFTCVVLHNLLKASNKVNMEIKSLEMMMMMMVMVMMMMMMIFQNN